MGIFHLGDILVTGGVILQILVSRYHRKAGSVIGILVTLALLIWGFITFSNDNIPITFTSLQSRPIFILLCVMWFGCQIYNIQTASRFAQGPRFDAKINELLGDAEKALSEGRIDGATALCKSALLMEIIQGVRNVLRSSDLMSFSKLVRIYQSNNLQQDRMQGLATEMDGYLAQMNIYARKPKDRRDFLLGLRKSGQSADSQAWVLGMKMSDFLLSLP